MGHLHQFDSLFFGYPVGISAIVIGLLILTLGRKLFWLFVGAIGFVFGLQFAMHYLYLQPNWIVLLVGLFAGIIGSILAVFLQRIAVVLCGFFSGSYLIINLLTMWGWHFGQLLWFFSIFGGIISAIVAAAYFDWALIILSSLTGATMISRSLHLIPSIRAIILVILIIVGIFIQAQFMQKDRSRSYDKGNGKH